MTPRSLYLAYKTVKKRFLFYFLLAVGLFFFDANLTKLPKDFPEYDPLSLYSIIYRHAMKTSCYDALTIFAMVRDGVLTEDQEMCYWQCHCADYFANSDAYWPSYEFPIITTGNVFEIKCEFCLELEE
jgi:hypothetical protein